VIVLDTNIISEIRKPAPSEAVTSWMIAQPDSELRLCDVVLMEQAYGAERFRLKTGSTRYGQRLDELMVAYRGRVLVLDREAAMLTGHLRARREAIGRAISIQDAMIAAICLSNGATLATPNTKDFEGLDLRLIKPFEGA
jgi:predicted nucleic acid-binding protein